MRRRNVALLVCASLASAFLVVLIVKPGGAHHTRTIDDLGELAAAAVAAAAGGGAPAGWQAGRGCPGCSLLPAAPRGRSARPCGPTTSFCSAGTHRSRRGPT